MAAMLTALTVFSDNGNTRTYSQAGHTASRPKIVIQKRRVPVGQSGTLEDVVSVIHATTDSEGAILAPKVSFEIKVRRPVEGQQADVDAALVVARDIFASDEYTAMVSTQNFLKN